MRFNATRAHSIHALAHTHTQIEAINRRERKRRIRKLNINDFQVECWTHGHTHKKECQRNEKWQEWIVFAYTHILILSLSSQSIDLNSDDDQGVCKNVNEGNESHTHAHSIYMKRKTDIEKDWMNIEQVQNIHTLTQHVYCTRHHILNGKLFNEYACFRNPVFSCSIDEV